MRKARPPSTHEQNAREKKKGQMQASGPGMGSCWSQPSALTAALRRETRREA